MSTGPSKQELEMYWQNSRQYFDELAKHYQQNDPEYYKQYILPFYSNPFHTVSSQNRRQGSGIGKIVAAFAVLAVLGVGAAAFFLIFSTSGSNEKFSEKKTENVNQYSTEETNKQQTTTEPVEPEPETEPGELSPEDNFIIGSKYLGEKKYDKAEYHLKKIKPGQKYYKEAQQILQNMKYLRK